MAQTAGRITLRFAHADVLPLRMTNFASTVDGYLAEIVELTDEMRAATERTNRLIREGLYELAADPTTTFAAPEPGDRAVPQFCTPEQRGGTPEPKCS